MNIAVISYHKNLSSIYPASWVDAYKTSVIGQSTRDFDIYELCYGKEAERIFDNSTYLHKEFKNFCYAQQYLLDHLFKSGYDCVFNSNCDDAYSHEWIEKMLPCIEKGFDIVGCNFGLFEDEVMIKKHEFHNLNIRQELDKNHNILCHPAICYNKTFWEKGNRYDPEEVTTKDEDMRLWKRAITNSKFIILPEHLCYHRLHSNSVCQSNNQ